MAGQLPPEDSIKRAKQLKRNADYALAFAALAVAWVVVRLEIDGQDTSRTATMLKRALGPAMHWATLCIFCVTWLMARWSLRKANRNIPGYWTGRAAIVLAGAAFFVGVFAAANFRDPWTGSQRSLFQSDIRAIEAYRVDHGAYPVGATGMMMIAGFDKDQRPIYEPLGTPDLPRLPTFPHGFGDRRPKTDPPAFHCYVCCSNDVLSTEPKARPVFYSSRNENAEGWILISAGLDHDYDIRPVKLFDPSTTQPSPALVHLTYDPTNGVNSSGDLWHLNQRIGKRWMKATGGFAHDL